MEPINKDEAKNTAKKRKDEAKTNYEIKLKYQYDFFLNSANGKKSKAPNAASWRSNFSYPTTQTMIRSYVPRLVGGLIGPDGTHFFSMIPRKDVDSNGNSTRDSVDVMTAVQNAHMQNRGTFRGIIEAAERNSATFGVGYIIQTWKYEQEDWTYEVINEAGDDTTIKNGNRTINEPLWYVPSTLNIWIDPAANTWEEVTYVVERRYSRLSSILRRANQERFSEAQVVRDIADAVHNSLAASGNQQNDNMGDTANLSGIDPVEDTYTIYTNDMWITLWRDEMIDCRPNPLAHHHIPVYPYIFENDTYTFMPRGIPSILSDIQQAQDVQMNLMIDNLNITVNTILVKPATAWLDESNLRWEPGTVMTENTPNTLRRLDLGSTNPEGFKLIENLAGLANQSLSTQDFMSAPAGVAAVNKTYGGLRLINQEGNKQISYIISSQKTQGLVPMLQDLKCLYGQFLGNSDVTSILGASEASRLKYDDNKDIAWEAEYDYVISGDLSIIDKQAKLENLEQGMQLLGAMGYNVNKDLVAKQIVDSLELDKSILLLPNQSPSIIQNAPAPDAAQVNPNLMPNPSNAGEQPNIQPAPGVAPGMAPVAHTPSNIAVPAASTGPASTQPLTISPDDERSLQQIALSIGVEPGRLIADVTNGSVPGGINGIVALLKTPSGKAKLKAILTAGHKIQA